MPRQVNDAVIVVEKVKERHDDAQEGDPSGHEDESSADVEDNVRETAEAFLLRKANRLLDEHKQAKDGKDLVGEK